MNILLYDVDSVLPNLALMKLSAYHKKNNDNVFLIRGGAKKIEIDYGLFDKGYASCIFTKNKNIVSKFPFDIGGTGVDIEKELPDEIEHILPDYSIYPENEYSIGFATRGCIRKCSFCFVPKKEGFISYNASVFEFLNPSLPRVMLLDNNIFGYKNYGVVFEELRKINKPSLFKQGMDFRILDDDKVENLLSIKYDGNYMFAYDSIMYKKIIEKQMEKYRGRFKDWALKFFVLVGFDSSIEEDVFRIKWLKSQKCLPYIMRHEKCYSSPLKDFYTDIAAWCNQVGFLKKMDFPQFLEIRHKNKDRISFSKDAWNKSQNL